MYNVNALLYLTDFVVFQALTQNRFSELGESTLQPRSMQPNHVKPRDGFTDLERLSLL
jgi:hypothetical protein